MFEIQTILVTYNFRVVHIECIGVYKHIKKSK